MSGSKEQKVPTEPAVAETPEKEPVPAAEAKKPAEKGAEKTAADAETKPEKKGRRRRRRNRKKGKKDTKDGENADTSDGDKEKPQDYVLQPVKKKKSPAARRKNKQPAGGQGGRGSRPRRGRGRGRGYFNYHGPGRPFPPYMFPPHHAMPPRGYPGYPPQMAGNYLPCDYEAVKRQLEFYFGEINLARDQFIRSHMDAQGFVPAYVMSGFPRMRNGMITPGEILHAASRSPLLDIRNGCIRSKRLWKRFANAKVQASLIQNLQKGLGVGDEVRPHGDDIPEGFGDLKCVIKKKIDNGRKSLIARADDPERCVIVLTAQLSAWSIKKPKKAPKAAPEAKESGESANKDDASASKEEGGDEPEASQE